MACTATRSVRPASQRTAVLVVQQLPLQATPRAAAIWPARSRSCGHRSRSGRVVRVAHVERQPQPGPGSRWARPAAEERADGRDEVESRERPPRPRERSPRPRRGRRGAAPSGRCPRGPRNRRSRAPRASAPRSRSPLRAARRAPRAPVPARCGARRSRRATRVRRAASASRAGSPPKARIASSSDTPAASARPSEAVSKQPASAELPRYAVPKRAPSSSAKATTSSANGRLRARPGVHRDPGEHAERAVVAAGVGHRVEVGAEQERGSVPSPRQRPITLPTASRRTAIPASRIQSATAPPAAACARRAEAARQPVRLLVEGREQLGSLIAARASGAATSAATVGAVGPGRDEQRDVVARCASATPKRTGTRIEERLIARRAFRSAEVGADVEDELVAADRELACRQQRPVGSPVGVCMGTGERLRAASPGTTRSSSIATPAAGRPRAVSSTWVVSCPVDATAQVLLVIDSAIVPKAGKGGTKSLRSPAGSSGSA